MRQFELSIDEKPPGEQADRATEIIESLNDAQREAVTWTEGPSLIVAGPGSGKTRVLTHRVAYLIATGQAQPFHVLALTFTNKAAREMKRRIEHLVGGEHASGIWMGTFHSIFSRILRREAELLGYTSDYTIYDTDDQDRIVRGLMDQYNVDPRQYPVRAIRSMISDARTQMISPAEYASLAMSPQQEKAAQLYRPYLEALRRSNAMDFDDLLIKPLELFTKNGDTLEKYQSRWRFIHIDEYQDTNQAQYQLTRLLAARHRNICVVGDDAQSIYAFRGADIGNILSFQKDYSEAKVLRLEQNYRSTGKILRLADSIIRNNEQRLEKTLWTENEEGEDVVLIEAISEKDEAQKIERRIRDIYVRGHHYRDCAVLYRTNAQSRSIEESLRRAGIPYRVIGGVSFYQRKEIKDVVAYLRLAVNAHDTASLRRVINYPTRGIGLKTVQRLVDFAGERDITPWSAIECIEEVGLAARAEKAVTTFGDLIRSFGEIAASRPADEVAREVIRGSGLLDELKRENTTENLIRWENVQELVNAIAEFVEASPEGGRLSSFLQEVSLLTDADEDHTEGDKVTLMTLHASKGLEFPVVFISGLEEGLFPLARATQERSELEEERRLFYVGVTRAEKMLFLTTARSRYRYGEQQSCVRSRFLDETAPGLIRTEAGADFTARKDRFTMRPGGPASYEEVDPYYYRRDLRKNSGGSSAAGRRVVYDEGEGGRVVVGAMVEHDVFGEGKVISVEGSGQQAKATVFFPDVGQKKLVLRFARLRLIG